MSARIVQQVKVPKNYSGMRLDQVAAELFPDFSRSRIQTWIKSADLLVDQRGLKPKAKLSGGELLTLDASLESQEQWCAEELPINPVFEDEHLLVINKPAGLVVHPGAGNWSGTLLNGLLFHYPELANIPRAGIVHRLDKDTTGLMVVAKTITSQLSLVEQLQDRSVSRTYWAIAHGETPKSGTIDRPMGRHPTQRIKMAVVKSGGKEAITHYKTLECVDGFSLVELKLATGRTHQIRVHMTDLGFPLVGDPVYGKSLSTSLPSSLKSFCRQALHAKSLGLDHPATTEKHLWGSELPEDMSALASSLGFSLEQA